MMDWILTSWPDVLMALVCFAVVYLAIITYCRIVGLRSFATMSAFDFATTVAVGSLFASSISTANPPLLLALVAFAALFAGQWLIGIGRQRYGWFKQLIDNEPLLLMRDGAILFDNLRKARITPDDLRAKLREANVLRYEHVRAVVAETSGTISVMHAPDAGAVLDRDLLADVRDERPQAETRSAAEVRDANEPAGDPRATSA